MGGQRVDGPVRAGGAVGRIEIEMNMSTGSM